MNRIYIYTLLMFLQLQPGYSQTVADQLSVVTPDQLTGHVNDRLSDSYKYHIMLREIDPLVAPFTSRTEKTQWQTEFWGKWFTSAVLAYRYHPDPELRKKLDYAVKGLLATQSDDGYIGNYAPESRLQQWDIWGRKYCMLGLLDYYDLTADKTSLKAAKRIADNLMADLAKADGIIVTKGNYRGMAASSVLEPITMLYTRTKDKKYLEFAEEIVRQWETPVGPQLISKSGVNVAARFAKPTTGWYSWEQGQKAYEMMSCYEGLLELFRVTGKLAYKEAVEKTWENIRDTEINVAGSGASAEMWFNGKMRQTSPVHHYQETCVTVTWIKLSQQLLRLTGEARYADAVENAYYNALLGSISGDGMHWAKYTPLVGSRMPGSGQCGMGMNCCEASGPRGLFNLPGHIVMRSAVGLQVNYFVGGVYKMRSPSGKAIAVKQETNYPEDGKANILLSLSSPEVFTVSLRIPDWSKQNTVLVNGVKVNADETGIIYLKRKWSNGDKISVELDMRGRIEWKGANGEFAVVLRGPMVLARDARLGNPDLTASLKPVTDQDGFLNLKPVQKRSSGIWMEYTAMFMPESYTEEAAGAVEVTLCDYASAGNGDQPSPFKVWLPQVYDPRK